MDNKGKRYQYHTPRHGVRSIGVEMVERSNFYAVCYHADGQQIRVYTTHLPAHDSAPIAQRALDQFAAQRGLKEAVAGISQGDRLVQSDLVPASKT